jgi:hypothetical protein
MALADYRARCILRDSVYRLAEGAGLCDGDAFGWAVNVYIICLLAPYR